MEFASGKHLTNYLLKIFKNNNVDIPKDYIEDIKDLEYVFNFITNLPNSIRRNIEFARSEVLYKKFERYLHGQRSHLTGRILRPAELST